MKVISVTTALACGLAACSSGIAIQGRLDGRPITGAVTGSITGGELTLTDGKDLSCSGPVVFTSPSTGNVTFHCTNGQTGASTFKSGAGEGTATGQIGGKPFSATFKTS